MDSAESPLWGVFDDIPQDKSFSNYQWRKYIPQAVDINQITTYEIRCTALNEWIIPSKSYLKLRLRIPTAKTAPTVTTPDVALANNCPIFSRGDYSVNGTQIETAENLHMIHLIRNYLDYSRDYARVAGPQQHFFPDGLCLDSGREPASAGAIGNYSATARAMAVAVYGGAAAGTYAIGGVNTNATSVGGGPTPANTLATQLGLIAVGGLPSYVNALNLSGAVNNSANFGNAAAANLLPGAAAATLPSYTEFCNPGYNARNQLATVVTAPGVAATQVITVIIPLARLFGFCQIEKAFYGCEHLIRFQKNNITSMLFNTVSSNVSDIYFDNSGNSYGMEWWIPVAEPSLSVRKNLFSSMAENAQVKLSWEAGYGYGKQPGGGQPSLPLTLTKKRPTKAIFVIRSSLNVGTQLGNPTTFIPGVTSNSLQNAYLLINGRSYPELRYDFYWNYITASLAVAQVGAPPYNVGVTDAAAGNGAGHDGAWGILAAIAGNGTTPAMSVGAVSVGSDVTRLYQEYLNCCDRSLDVDSSPLFNYREFATNYPMYCFDLRKLSDDVFENPSNVLQFCHTGSINSGDWVDAVIFYESKATISSISNQITVSL